MSIPDRLGWLWQRSFGGRRPALWMALAGTLLTALMTHQQAAFASATPRVTAAAGTLLTLLATWLVAALAGARERLAAHASALDGRWLWLQARAQVTVRRPDGSPQRLSGTVVDISEQHEAARRWLARAELSGDWFWITDEAHRFVDFSSRSEQLSYVGGPRMVGARRDEVDFIDPPEEGWAAFHARLDRHEAFRGVTYLNRARADAPRWIEIDGRPHFDEAGRFAGYEGVGRDVTERRQVVQELRDSLALIDALFEAIPIPVLLKDTQGRYVRANRAMLDLMPARAATAIEGRQIDELVDAVAAERHRQADQELFAMPGRVVYEVRQTLDGGQAFDALIHKATLLDADGRITGLVATTTDITEQRRQSDALREARDAAEAANRAKSAFLATMSHEIRTPMNGVVALAELLSMSALDAGQVQTVATIHQSALALMRILDDILDFSKIEAGRLELEDEVLAVQALVQGLGDALAPLASARGVMLAVQIDADVPAHVRGDATRLRQVLHNLLGNAIKFTADRCEARVLLRARSDALGIAFVVQDNGIGIDEATQARLFTPFTQAEVSTTRRFGGTGLGLAICRRLVKLMDGRIDVTSRAGAGSTFTVRLPLVAAAAPSPRAAALAAPAAARAATPAARILVAEDDAVNRIVIQRQLELLGHHAEVAGNGSQALALWRGQRGAPRPFELLLTDLHMPEMDGYALVAAVRADEAAACATRLPILALTANALEGEAQRARVAGMDGYLTKPLPLAQLRAALAAWLPETAAA